MINNITDIEATIEKYGDPEDSDKIPPSSIHALAVELAQELIETKVQGSWKEYQFFKKTHGKI